MHQFEYYIPPFIRIVTFLIMGLLCLGAFGFIDESFGQSIYHKTIVGGLFAFSTYLILVPPYKNKFITITEEYVEVPDIIFPPFKCRRIYFSNIVKLKKGNLDSREIEIITIFDNYNKIKICNMFCHNNKVSWERFEYQDYLEIIEILRGKINKRFGL